MNQGPLRARPHLSRVNLPSMEAEVETEEILPSVESESTNTDLPNFGDLLEDM